MIGIIGALDVEVNALIAALEGAQIETISGITYAQGLIAGVPVVVARCGVGKVNAAVCAQTMILKYHADSLINTGVGGALDSKLRVGDIVVGTDCVQHDFDTVGLGDEPGFVSTVNVIRFPLDDRMGEKLSRTIADVGGARVTRGTIATGDQFIACAEKKTRFVELFQAKACDMEGAAIAHVAYLSRIPCAVVRAISDGADGDAHMSYGEFAAYSADIGARALLKYIQAYAQ